MLIHMTKGKIKWYNESKGYGFIITDEGKDVFVHQSGFSRDYGYISEDQKVVFTIKQGDKGLVAVDVKQDN